MRAACGFVAAGLALLACVIAADARSAQDSAPPIVYEAELDGLIHPVSAEFLKSAISQADAAGASLFVITLRTPGGLVDSTRDINAAIIAARTPVAVFVGPSGGRAASAGFLITMAADIAAMAPGTHIGAAHPVSGNGEEIGEVMSKKMTSDIAGYARTLAAQRHRNVELVEKAVTESATYTEQEALAATPPLIDLVVPSVPELLQKLDGRTIRRFDGREQTLHTAGAQVRTVAMTFAQRLLSALAHPQIAYLLLMLGTLGVTVELWSPGAILPGVAGGICLLLAFFAFQVLPVSVAGVLLILFGIVLLILEVKVTSFGLLAVGGLVSLFLGSMMLVDSPLPELQVGLRTILPVTIAIAAIILFLVRLAVQAQRTRPTTGTAGMLDETGVALSAIEPGGTGRVRTRGEIWTATADVPIHAGDAVRVVDIRGLLLRVRPEHNAPVPPGGQPAQARAWAADPAARPGEE
jgi:membrane-bound serine protease (ClpP class)